MTSNINFISINENFPVPGQDNDTQVFRDNFDTIKTSLRTAKDEITDLQDNTARKDQDNDFDRKQLRNLVLGKTSLQSQIYNNNGAITNASQEINFFQGLHHVIRVGGPGTINFQFVGFPGDPNIAVGDLLSGMGRISLEIYGDGAVNKKITFNQPNGTVIKASDFPLSPSKEIEVQSASDPVLLEVYRYNSAFIFIRYLGQYV